MTNNNTEPELLVEHLRGKLVDEEHYGFIVLSNKERAIDFTGDSKIIRFIYVPVQNRYKQA